MRLQLYVEEHLPAQLLLPLRETLESCGTNVSTAPGVWYSILGDGSEITVNTFGSTYDTKLGVYSGSCEEKLCIAGNDDTGGLQSEVVFTSEIETTYLIYVTGFSANTGDYILNVTCAEDIDCPELGLNIGDACDDGSEITIEDTVNELCVCEGLFNDFDCPELILDFGDACDDGNSETSDDIVNDDCICEGTPIVDAPENDLCENATSIECGGSATGSTSTATADSELAFCGTTVNSAPGVWYSIVGDGSEISVNTFESGL